MITRKSYQRVFRIYQEDASGRLAFKVGDTRTFKDLRAVFYERVLRRVEERKYGFSFRIDIRKPIKRLRHRTFMGQTLIDKRKFRYFHGNIREYQLRNLFYRAFKKGLSFHRSILYIFESRVDLALYRLNYVRSLKMARQLIKHHGILINYCRINRGSTRMYIGDLLSFDEFTKTVLIRLYKSRFKAIDNPIYNEHALDAEVEQRSKDTIIKTINYGLSNLEFMQRLKRPRFVNKRRTFYPQRYIYLRKFKRYFGVSNAFIKWALGFIYSPLNPITLPILGRVLYRPWKDLKRRDKKKIRRRRLNIMKRLRKIMPFYSFSLAENYEKFLYNRRLQGDLIIRLTRNSQLRKRGYHKPIKRFYIRNIRKPFFNFPSNMGWFKLKGKLFRIYKPFLKIVNKRSGRKLNKRAIKKRRRHLTRARRQVLRAAAATIIYAMNNY